MTFAELTERVVLREGLKKSISIAQVKEVTKIVLDELAHMPMAEAVHLIHRTTKKK